MFKLGKTIVKKGIAYNKTQDADETNVDILLMAEYVSNICKDDKITLELLFLAFQTMPELSLLLEKVKKQDKEILEIIKEKVSVTKNFSYDNNGIAKNVYLNKPVAVREKYQNFTFTEKCDNQYKHMVNPMKEKMDLIQKEIEGIKRMDEENNHA